MKFVCSQNDLKSNLSLVSRAVPSRPTHPILANVLLVADEESGRINLTGFDLSLGIHTSFPAQILQGGKLTLPAKLLNDIVSRLPEGEITLASELSAEVMEDTNLSITSASGSFQVRGIGADEYPDLPTVEDEEALILAVEALTEGLRGTAFAASTDETKQVLTGVHLTGSQDSLEFAATDGHRLAMVQTSNQQESEGEESKTSIATTTNFKDFQVTIPARALRELEKMLNSPQSNQIVTLHVNEAQVIFALGDQRLTSRKLEGAYPVYQQLIPRQFARQIILEKKRLLSSLELVAVLADQKNNIVKFTVDSDSEQLALSVDAKDIGRGKQLMPARITGDSIELAFNVKYLMDGLKALPSTEIQMQVNEPLQPVIFTPLGGVKMTYLVMPVQLRD